jgi:HSP20 family protein
MTLKMERYEERNKPGQTYPASPFRLFEDFFNDWALKSWGDRRDGWTPPVDIFEKEGNLQIMVSLPGINEKEIELKIEGQVLTIQGERKSAESEGYTYHRKESNFGNFSRSFTLTDSMDLGNIKADYKNGILAVSIPQKPEVKPRTIKINT